MALQASLCRLRVFQVQMDYNNALLMKEDQSISNKKRISKAWACGRTCNSNFWELEIEDFNVSNDYMQYTFHNKLENKCPSEMPKVKVLAFQIYFVSEPTVPTFFSSKSK